MAKQQDQLADKRQPKTMAQRAAALAQQSDSMAVAAENHPELSELGEAVRYRREAIDLRRQAFTLRLQSRRVRPGLRATPRQRRSREHRPSASRRVSRTAGSRGDPHPEPEPPLAPWRGLSVASVHMLARVRRREAKRAAA
jgi:hypothetical protein